MPTMCSTRNTRRRSRGAARAMTLHHRGSKVSEVPSTIEHAAAPVVAHHAHVAHQFDDLEQQHEADTLGMWIFLATEVLFFSALFTTYATYRFLYPEGF